MPATKRALLVGVPDQHPGGLRPAPSLAAMAALLGDLGGWQTVKLTGAASHRENVLQALEAMTTACGPRDTCLFYFFGHGGVVRFSSLAGDLGRRPVFYLATLRSPGAPMIGLLDVEISEALARLDEICGNVTAILDCCHAASIVRGGTIPTIPPPAWVQAETRRARTYGHLLAPECHPTIVRLLAASSLRTAYPEHGPSGELGLLTKGFVEVVREAELCCDRLCWDAVAHRAREQASLARGMEEQRVVLAGPRQRLLFSTRTTSLPRSAAFLPGADPGRGWLRVGALQGTQVGDRWSLAALTVGDDLEPLLVAEAEVRRVELDRCEVNVTPPSPRLAPGTSALLRRFEQRIPVGLDAPPSIIGVVEASGLLHVDDFDAPGAIARARYRPTDEMLEVFDDQGQLLWPRCPTSPDGLRDLVGLLEDRAGARRLQAALLANDGTATKNHGLRWRWGTLGPHGEPLELGSADASPTSMTKLHDGDPIWIELSHTGFPPTHWFVCVISIAIAGRPVLLNAREPEGIEVAPGIPVHVGLHGCSQRQRLQLHWPADVPRLGPRAHPLLVVASTRPLALGHLVRIADPGGRAALVARGLASDAPTRGTMDSSPEVSRGWTWGRIDFLLHPHPR